MTGVQTCALPISEGTLPVSNAQALQVQGPPQEVQGRWAHKNRPQSLLPAAPRRLGKHPPTDWMNKYEIPDRREAGLLLHRAPSVPQEQAPQTPEDTEGGLLPCIWGSIPASGGPGAGEETSTQTAGV